MKKYIQEFYGNSPHKNAEYPKIINEKHFVRLNDLISNSKVIFGGENNSETHQIEPTLIDCPDWNATIMQDEIFGPLLPIIEYDDLDKIIFEINNRPKTSCSVLFYPKLPKQGNCNQKCFLRRRLHKRYDSSSGEPEYAVWRCWRKRCGQIPRQREL